MGCCEYLGIYLGVAVVIFIALSIVNHYRYEEIDFIDNLWLSSSWGILLVMLIFAGIYEMIKRN